MLRLKYELKIVRDVAWCQAGASIHRIKKRQNQGEIRMRVTLTAALLASAAVVMPALAQEDNLRTLQGMQKTDSTFTYVDQTGEVAESLQAILPHINVPDGFEVSLYAVVPDARSIAVAPQGTVTFVGTRKDKVWSIVDRNRDRVADARENVSRISQMADRMATLSRHLRNFARRPQETTGPVDISLVLDDALDLMAPRLSKAGAVVHRDPSTCVPTWVIGGRVRLQQVFVNLISNALDAMERLETPQITITAPETRDGRIAIAVSDIGPGFDADTVGRIFDPFFTTKSPGKGLGLGLSISYNIVEDFGGRLSATDAPEGRGASFVVDLARADAPSVIKDVAAE